MFQFISDLKRRLTLVVIFFRLVYLDVTFLRYEFVDEASIKEHAATKLIHT